MLAYLANTLIFMIVGVVIAERAMANVESMDWFYLLSLYIGINIIRYDVFLLYLSKVDYNAFSHLKNECDVNVVMSARIT